MSAVKWSVSIERSLAEQVREAAGRSGETLSSWLAAAAERRLKLEAMREALESYEREQGVVSDREVAEARERLGL